MPTIGTEEIRWSDLISNAQQMLTPASLSLRQTVSLDDATTYMKIPDFANVQPLLIGPITDTLTFYSDLLLAIKEKLMQPGQTAYVSRTSRIPGRTGSVCCSARTWLLFRCRGIRQPSREY